jgi:hypothetical protein
MLPMIKACSNEGARHSASDKDQAMSATDNNDDDFQTELTEVLLELTKIVSRMRMLQAQDDPKLAALLVRSNAVLERLTTAGSIFEPIRIQ